MYPKSIRRRRDIHVIFDVIFVNDDLMLVDAQNPSSTLSDVNANFVGFQTSLIFG
jgi:hypothetical protein